MPDKPFRVLLRVAIELSSRACATRRYLETIGPGEAGEHRQLIQTIRTALDGVEQLLPATLEGVAKFLGSGEPGRSVAIEVLASYLAKFSRWFKTIHELLVYLPRKTVTPEAVSAIEATFGQCYDLHRPSIILGSLFNALEFDFFQVVRDRLPDLDDVVVGDEKNIVLQLAICDRESPHAWPILAHEMGHAIDLHEGISRAVANQFVTDPHSPAYEVVRSWCQELAADLIAAKALGPAPMLALLSLEYCLFPLTTIFFPSNTHPSTRWRLKIVSQFLKSIYGGKDYLEDEILFYESSAEYSLHRAVTDHKDRVAALEADKRQFEFIIAPIADVLMKSISAVELDVHLLSDSSLLRCASRLRQGLPISAQGATREGLQDALKEYRAHKFTSKASRVEAFQSLLPLFKEDPLDMPTIFLSGFRHRIEMINGIIDEIISVGAGDDGNSTVIAVQNVYAISTLCSGFERLDELIANSINTSSVHRRLEKRHHG